MLKLFSGQSHWPFIQAQSHAMNRWAAYLLTGTRLLHFKPTRAYEGGALMGGYIDHIAEVSVAAAFQLTAANEQTLESPDSATAKAIGDTARESIERHKKSTAKGEAEVKLVFALTQHHEYYNGSCLKLEPI